MQHRLARERGQETKKPGLIAGLEVAHRGFEPLIFALRGRCPRPLDECAMHYSADCTRNGGFCQTAIAPEPVAML